jgi:hypothetical protein
MTAPAATVSLIGNRPESRASADELLNLTAGDDFARWEQQLAATGNCANPVRLHGRIDASTRPPAKSPRSMTRRTSRAVCCEFPAATAASTSARPARRCTRVTPGRSSGPG